MSLLPEGASSDLSQMVKVIIVLWVEVDADDICWLVAEETEILVAECRAEYTWQPLAHDASGVVCIHPVDDVLCVLCDITVVAFSVVVADGTYHIVDAQLDVALWSSDASLVKILFKALTEGVVIIRGSTSCVVGACHSAGIWSCLYINNER